MKRVLVILAVLAMTGIASADLLNFTVDPDATWLGFINVFDQADNFQFGFVEGNLATASASFAAGPSLPLVVSPNTRLYDENAADSFWVDQGTFEATLVSEFNFYQEVFDADPLAFQGQTATFDFTTVSNNLPAGYDAVGFIKVLDGFSSWATYQITTVDLTGGSSGSLSLLVDGSGLTGAGTPFVQAGFWVKGAYVSSDDPAASTGVEIIPEPFTIALLGLGGLFLRRRK